MGWGFSSHRLLGGGNQGGVWWEAVSMEKESPDERRGGRRVTEAQELGGRRLAELLEDTRAAALGFNL